MSVATEISRIQTARNAIRSKAAELGIGTGTDDLTKLAAEIEAIENRGAVSATVQEGDTYTIPKGYHNGSGTVSGVSGGGNYNLQSKTVTPTKAQPWLLWPVGRDGQPHPGELSGRIRRDGYRR